MYGMSNKQLFIRGVVYTLGIIVLGLVLYTGYRFAMHYLYPPAPVQPFNAAAERSSEQQAADAAAAASLAGKIYYSSEVAGVPAEQNFVPVTVSTYDVSNDQIRAFTAESFNTEHAPLGDGSILQLGVGDYNDLEGPNGIHPVRYYPERDEFEYVNQYAHWGSLWSESHIRAVGDGRTAAFTYQAVREDSYSLDVADWSVAIVDIEDDQVVTTIENAVAPIWINDGADLLYIRDDSIVRYNRAADTHIAIFTGVENLTPAASLEVSQSNHLILTSGLDGTILVFDVISNERLELALRSYIQDEGRIYRTPVAAPDGVHYAVIAGTPGEGQLNIEVRRIDSNAVVRRIALEHQEKAIPTQLHYWSAN